MAAMGAAWAWAGSELRRRVPATIALVLLVGLAGAVVLGALAGARRTDTAFERALDAARTADVRVQYSSEGDVDDEVLDAIRAQPDVVEAHPFYITLALNQDSDYDLSILAGPDDELFSTFERPRLLAGRRADPSAVNEVTVNEFASRALGVGVGDSFEVATLSPEQLDEEDFSEPAGPSLELRVVGIVRLPDDVADEEFPGIFATPAFHEAHWGETAGFGPSIGVAVRDGADAVAVVDRALEGFELDEVQLGTRQDLSAQVEDGTHAVALGLLAFAAAAAVATVVAGAQAIHRRLADVVGDQGALNAIGLTTAQRFAGILLVALPAVVGGVVLAVVGAAAGSPLMPVGTARRAEPSPGVRVEAPTLALGAAGLLVSLLLLAAWSARSTARAGRRLQPGSIRAGGRPNALGRLLRTGASAPSQLGIAMALDPGAGPTTVPVRSALAGAVFGVAGVVGALTFAASLHDLTHSPARYGWAWTLAPELDEHTADLAASMDDVTDVGMLVHRQVVVHDEQLLGIAVAPVAGSPSLAVRAGRMPTTPDEIAVGPQTADRWGVHVGDTVVAGSSTGARTLRIVGEVLFPVFDENAFNDGVALHPDLIDEVAVSDGFERGIVTFASSVPLATAAERLEQVDPDAASVYALPSPPPEIANLSAVRSLPPALAAFLFLLAAAAVGHALATSVRRRRHDLGTVRALGFVRAQVRTAITVQSVTLLAGGLLVGAPLGTALGRMAWRAVAGGLGVDPSPATPGLALAALVPVAALVAIALAALPGRVAARLAPADALRVE